MTRATGRAVTLSALGELQSSWNTRPAHSEQRYRLREWMHEGIRVQRWESKPALAE